MRYVKHMIACFLGLLLMGLCSYSVEAAQLADYGEVIITKGNQSVIQTTWNLLNPQEKGLTWEFQSNRPEVATVDQQGIISAKKKGKAKITRILKNIGMVEAVEGAQVVGLADTYDELIRERGYDQTYSHEKAVHMILTGECGAFSEQLRYSFLSAAMQPEWKQMELLSDQ